MRNNNLLNDTVWGSRLFINAQFTMQLVSLLSKYINGEGELQNVFVYANALKQQRKVKLYAEVKREVDEICFLEKEIKAGEIGVEDKKIIDFVLNNIILVFTTQINRK